ncbi:MAG: tRNA (adenosine(37)-N6)-dimethylallyltransferase MiaA [Magnetococcales bacterium]|nr:tRNA (adenosine(37)-N6)-dimethylallyltransferase MiaA [Magnetococcales bacterium]MBF0149055.1 tRNA (adenosine(37)-N6)-dimethylallyltransferase MiaA [Magnetococcales bacterium]MBF0173890.1 tRNA (adenosine(37)-N6)-dimethylallyltransferase MiaA [Magnetococcales bacterium]MBF0348910.1 tRNA (adenosine(37)-N6)-dimethylallyltransferase MiaA [Magnetococcales bacterium]MBF0630187.1 tRNA (adenosine(37)-N6)-dimethylallyltransferase MiaA [Magnetococcales bacterium]
MSGHLLVVVGATASGKTRLGVELAGRLSGEIISADSRQVYRGLDLGTGKDLHEYGSVRHHLIDIVDPGTEFSVFDFQKRCYQSIIEIQQRGNLPCLVGGSGLYLESILLGYRMVVVPENPDRHRELEQHSDASLEQSLRELKPHLHNVTDLESRARLIRAIEIAEAERVTTAPVPPGFKACVLGIHWPRPVLRERIRKRLEDRLAGGLIQEVLALLDRGVSHERLESLGLEYRWVSHHVQGALSMDELLAGLSRAIAQYAKRQETWFRRMERRGVAIAWLEGGDDLLDRAWNLCSALQGAIPSPTGP